MQKTILPVVATNSDFRDERPYITELASYNRRCHIYQRWIAGDTYFNQVQMEDFWAEWQMHFPIAR